MKDNLILFTFTALTTLAIYSLVTSEKIDKALGKAKQYLTREIHRDV